MLTKTLEWNLHWCILDAMLDHNFRIKEEFKHDVTRLQRRFRYFPMSLISTSHSLLPEQPIDDPLSEAASKEAPVH